MHKRIFFIFTIIFILFLMYSFAGFDGNVTFIKGKAFFKDTENLRERILEIGIKENFVKKIIKTTKGSIAIIILNNEAEIRCGENTQIYFQEDKIKILSGKVWMRKIKSEKEFTVETLKKKLKVSYGSFNIDSDRKAIEVYNGAGIVIDNKRNTFLDKNKKYEGASVKNIENKDDDWVEWNLKRDKIDMVVTFDFNNKNTNEITEIIKKVLIEKYIFSDIIILDKKMQVPECDVILICDFDINSKNVKINSKLKNGINEKILTFFEIEHSDLNNGLFLLLSQVTNYLEIEYFKNIIINGKDIIIEVNNIKSEEIDILKEYVTNITGIKNVKIDEFYGQKVVFHILYSGIADDIVEYFKEKKIKEKNINIWKYSKNIVKLNL